MSQRTPQCTRIRIEYESKYEVQRNMLQAIRPRLVHRSCNKARVPGYLTKCHLHQNHQPMRVTGRRGFNPPAHRQRTCNYPGPSPYPLTAVLPGDSRQAPNFPMWASPSKSPPQAAPLRPSTANRPGTHNQAHPWVPHRSPD